MNIKLGKKVKPPAGYIKMLVKSPVMAMKDYAFSKARDLKYSEDDAKDMLRSTFNVVNSAFIYRKDSLFDNWTIHSIIGKEDKSFEGDCEDFALTCRDTMIE